MKTIIGLGNPGKEYENTRHNVGFMFVDYILNTMKKEDIREKKLKNSITYVFRDKFILSKPQTFMNKSGEAVREIVKWFDSDIMDKLYIVHDDLDIGLGSFKIQFAKSSRDHNGILSIEKQLSTKDFYRVRIGIDNRDKYRIPGEKYVLERFKTEELNKFGTLFDEVYAELVDS